MTPEDDVCLCFHVSCRKLVQFVRVERPARASQMSNCGGAGTGCGWCVPMLEKIFHNTKTGSLDLPEAEDWSERRARYLARGKIREDEV